MSIVSSNGMLVKKESTSKLSIKNSESCSTISSAKANESFTLHSLLVKDFKVVTKYFADLYVGVLIADKICRKDW